MAWMGFTEIHSACHCGSTKITATVPSSSLPLPIKICHCTSCRVSTGTICATLAPLPEGSKPLQVRGKAPVMYKTSAQLSRHFCGACGTKLYEVDGHVYLTTGAIKNVKGEDGQLLIQAKEHIFVEDSQDGGLRDWMTELPAWRGWAGKSESVQEGKMYGSLKPSAIDKSREGYNDERLQCACHCGGVSFTISRPNEASAKAKVKEYTDLLVPWGADPSRRGNTSNEPYWLREDKTKFIAGVCVCDDCRTALGHEVQAWAWIPMVNVHVEDRGTLKRYKGSDRAWREFCGTCSANVFFNMEKTEGVREIVDVSVGVMRSSHGARAEDWLGWYTQRVSYEDLTDNEPFSALLGQGMRAWGHARGVKETKRRLVKI